MDCDSSLDVGYYQSMNRGDIFGDENQTILIQRAIMKMTHVHTTFYSIF